MLIQKSTIDISALYQIIFNIQVLIFKVLTVDYYIIVNLPSYPVYLESTIRKKQYNKQTAFKKRKELLDFDVH